MSSFNVTLLLELKLIRKPLSVTPENYQICLSNIGNFARRDKRIGYSTISCVRKLILPIPYYYFTMVIISYESKSCELSKQTPLKKYVLQVEDTGALFNTGTISTSCCERISAVTRGQLKRDRCTKKVFFAASSVEFVFENVYRFRYLGHFEYPS